MHIIKSIYKGLVGQTAVNKYIALSYRKSSLNLQNLSVINWRCCSFSMLSMACLFQVYLLFV